jgi:exocyst complex component 4
MSRRGTWSTSLKESKEESRLANESIFELKEVYNTIKYDWPQFIQDESNPIETAVSLLDDTSVGLAHRLPEFTSIKEQTEAALRHVVNEHHELFNNSIGSYHLLLSSLKDSQDDSLEIKEMLESTTKDIHDRSDTLNDLSQTSTRYAEMIEILDAITEVTGIPDKIDQLVIDKKIHEVYDVIANGYKTAEKYNLWSLPAMNTIQAYLDTQSNNLFDMIVDELQNEIYLKSSSINIGSESELNFFSWQTLLNATNPKLSSIKTLVTDLHSVEQYIYNSANLDIAELTEVFAKPIDVFVSSELPKLHSHYSNHDTDIDYSILIDSSLTFHSESFHYIYMLLHTAFKLSRLHQVVEILTASNQAELSGLINRTTEEVKQLNVIALGKLSKLRNFDQSTTADIIGNGSFNDNSVTILKDLFGVVFIRSLAVFQRHKVVSEIIDKIERSQNLQPSDRSGTTPRIPKNAKTYDLVTVWNTMKKELHALMINYIYDSSAIPLDSANDIILSNKIYDTVKNRDVFRFEDVSFEKTCKGPEDLGTILHDMFPSFVLSDSIKSRGELGDSSSPFIQTDRFNAMVEVLVTKNLLNMRIILEFFLIFIAGAQKMLSNFAEDGQNEGPVNTIALQFFNDFMKISFLSNVKESLNASFRQYIGSTHVKGRPTGLKLGLISLEHADNENQINEITTHKNFTVIYQNALDFKRLLLNICSVLNTSLTYRKDFCNTVLDFLKTFSDTYLNYYHELLADGTNTVSDYSRGLATEKPVLQISKWMRLPALADISGAILQSNSSGNSDELEALISKEIQILLYSSEGSANALYLNKDEVLDQESFSQVCYLLVTTSWILTWLPLIKKESNYAFRDDDDSEKISTVDKLRYDWSFLENGRSNIIVTTGTTDFSQHNIYLALNPENIANFDEIVQTFESIRDRTLLALRYDLRCKAIYYIGNSFRQTDWVPHTEPGDADQFIGLLNKEVFSIENTLNEFLSELEKESIFVGLSEFLNDLIILGSRLVRKISANGIKRILLNIFTLQQMLRNLLKNPESVDFTKSSVYFEMFTLNEFSFLKNVSHNTKHEYTITEFNNLARLVYSEKLADGNGTQFNKTKYADLLKKIETSFKN